MKCGIVSANGSSAFSATADAKEGAAAFAEKLPKDSGRFDLPIALGVLAATGQLPQAPLATHEFVGELALTGALARSAARSR